MRRPALILIFLTLVGGYSVALANTAPYFTEAVTDTNLTEDVYWSTWLMAADDDDDPLTYAFANDVPDGMTINSTSGRITWTPDNDAVGTHRILASVSDNNLTAYLEFFLHVQNVNDPPFWVNITADTVTVAEDGELELTVTANDDDLPHGDHITYSVIRGDNVSINSVTGAISASPDNSNVGFQTITVRARDDSSAAIEWSFVLETTNTPVVFTNIPPTEINEDDSFGFDLNADDEGQGNTVYYFQSGFQPEWMGIDAATGYISGIPNNLHVKTDTVTIIVDDDNGSTDTLSYELTVVNRKPVITSPTLHDATEDIHFALDIHADDEGLGTTSYQFLDDLESHPDWLSLRTNDGVISGTPNNAHVGPNSFYLEFHDGHGGRDTTQFVINVANAPVVIDSTNLIYIISEDQEYYYKFTSSDDGQGNVTYHGVNLPDWLAINLNSGVLRGTPNNEDVGDFNLSVYVSDGTDTDTVDFTIRVANRIPLLESSPVVSVEEDNLYTYDLDYDDEGEGAVYSWLTQPAWLSLNPSTGELSGTPDNSDVSEHVISVQVDDGNGGIVSHTFSITVVNRNPVFTPQADTTVTQYESLTIDLDTDDEGDPQVTYALLEPPDGAVISPNDGIFSWTPTNAQVGTHEIRISGTDNHGGTSILTFNTTVSNQNPVIISSPVLTATENVNYYYDVQCNEEGDGNVSYSLSTAPDWLSIDPDAGIVQGIPGNPAVGDHSVTVRINDGNGGFVTQSWTITVQNINPTILTGVLDPATEDSAYSFQIDYIPANQGDHTFSIVGDKPGWLSINALNGRLSGTPTNSEVGSDSITVKIADDYGGYDQKRLEIVVNNSLPLFTTTDDVTITEDETLGWDINTNDEGDEGPGASGYNLVEAPDWLSISAATGELTGTPRDNHVGTFPLSVRYQDGNGGIVLLNINIVVANNPPTITSLNPTTTATEGINYIFQFTSDEDDWNPTYTSGSDLPANMTLTTDGLLSGIPLNTAVGNHPINIVVTDNNGGQDELDFTLSIANAAPTITGYTVSNPKSTVVDTVYITEDIAYTVDFSADDEADGTAALYTINHKPGWLTTTSTVNGTLAGTPDNRQVGLDYVDITFNDGNGGSDNMRLYLRVQNIAPAFIDAPASLTATEDAEFYYDLNSSDEGQGTITYTITAGDPGWLSLDAATGEISGTPDNDDVTDGVDVTFRVTDGNDGTASKTIVFIVENTNDPPTWVSVPGAGTTISTAEDALYTMDIDASDVDVGDEISYSLDTYPTGMTINSSTGVISWTPDNSQVGDHIVTARATDGTVAITRSWTVRVTNTGSPIAYPEIDDFTPSIAVTAVADTFYVIEDTIYTLDLSAPDEGSGAASIYSFDEFPNPGWITLSDANSGLVSLAPTNSAVGLDSFLVYFKDQPASRDTITIYLRVANVAPEILTTGPFPAVENELFVDTLKCSDDGDGVITWSFVSGKPGWLEIDANSGELSGTPGNTDVISDASFIVRVNDGNGGVTQKSFDYSVENVNTPPSITVVPAGIITIKEDLLYTTDVDATDADAGDVLSYSLNTAPTGMTINAATGVIQWTPSNAQVGTHTVTVKVTDSEGEFASSSWQLQVSNMNDPPSWVSVPSGTIQTDEDALYNVTLEAEDIDVGDQLTYSLLVNPDGMTIDANTGLIAWTPDNDDVGLHDISVRAVDDSAAAITAGWTLEVRNVNNEPNFTAVPTGTITSTEDTPFTTDVDATDADAGDVITYSLTQSPAGMTINTTSGVINWTPDNSQVGNHSISIRATDLAGAFASQTFTLQVTNVPSPITAPVAGDFTPSAAVTVAADTFYIKEDTVYTLDLTAPDEGVGAASTYSFDDFSNPDWVSLTDATSGLIILTPTNGNVGLDSFLVYFRDQPGSRDTVTVYLRVENVAPEILTDGPFTATEGQAFSGQLESSDDDDGTITWSFVSGKPGWLEIDSNGGILSGTPADADVISDGVFVIRVDDGNGGAVQKEFTYNVINANNDPYWTSVPSGTITTNEDALYSVTISAGDEDLDNGDVITYSLVNPPSGMTVNSTTGVISWTPDNGDVGSHTITVKAQDSAADSPIQANYTLNVINVAPSISALTVGDFDPAGTVSAVVDTFYIWEDSTFTIDFNADDESQGAGAIYRIAGLSDPDWVSLSDGTGGILHLEPINIDVGLDTVRIVFDDGQATDTAQVYIRVQNSVPQMIAAGPFSATEDDAFDVDLESTDEDVNSLYSFVGVYPDWMSINASTGLITGTPTNDDVGTATFTVRINDGNGGTDDQVYTINVANTNDPPIITSTAITAATEDVLYLYDLNATDQDGDPIVYRLVTYPDGMTIDSTTGIVRWTPDNNFGGASVSVIANVEDSTGYVVPHAWNINVANADPNFLTNDPAFNATEDAAFSVDLSVDDEGEGVSNYAVIHLPAWMTLQNAVTGIIGGTPDNSYVNSSDSVYMEFLDGNGGRDTLNIPINVANVVPVFQAQTDTTIDEADALVIDLNCDDEGAGGVNYTAQSPLPDWLSLNASTGELTGTPDNSDIGSSSISVRATDNFSGYENLSFQITVLNKDPVFTGSPLATIEEDSLYEYTLTVADGAGTNTFSILTNPGWLAINGSTGKLSGTAMNDDVGDNAVSVRVTDGNGGSDTLDFIITVVNSRPQFTTIPVTSCQEDIQYSLDLNCSDEGQGIMIYTALRKPEWLNLNLSSGLLKGTPLNQHVTTGDTVEIEVNDGNGGLDTLKYALAVSNKGPGFSHIFTDTTITEDDIFAYDVNSDDEGQGATVYSFTNTVPDWIALDANSGVISGTPLNGDVENAIALNIKVDDGNGGIKTKTVTLSVNNNLAHFLSTITDSIATEDELFTYDPDVDDEDQGDAVYSFTGLPAWLSGDDTTGVLSGTPGNDDVDTSAITIRFADGNGSVINQLIHVIVKNANDAPVLTTTTTQDTIYEDSLWIFQFTATDIDSVYGDTLSFELQEFPNMMQVDSATGLVSWTPQNADVGDTSFELWVFDKARASDSLTFRLHILNTNDSPRIIAQADTIAREDELFSYTIRFEDVDVGDSATFSLEQGPPAMQIDGDAGLIFWTPTNDDREQSFEIIYSVTDGAGEADLDTFHLFVENVNDVPVLAALDEYMFSEDSSLIIQISDWFNHVTDIDDPDSALSWQVISFNSVIAVIQGDSVLLTAPPDWFGPDTGEVVVSDGELSDTTGLIVIVLPVNDAPVIAAEFPAPISFDEDDSTTLNLNDYVTDVDNDKLELHWSVEPVEAEKSTGDPALSKFESAKKTRIIKSYSVNSRRSLLVNSNGDSIRIDIDPVTNLAKFYAQPDFCIDGFDFRFIVNDSTDGAEYGCDSVITTIRVDAVNDAPVFTTLPELDAVEDSTITLRLSDWFQFVGDVDNHDTTLIWTILDGNYVSGVIADSIFSIIPPENWFGNDTLQIIATDAELLADTTEVIVQYQPVNDAPVFSPIPDLSFPEDDTFYVDLNDYAADIETPDDDLVFGYFRADNSGTVGTSLPNRHQNALEITGMKSGIRRGFSQSTNSATDSIIIAIHPTTHVATISGGLNYFTPARPFGFTVSDGIAADTVTVMIAIEPVNDRPVLDSLPPIVFVEDSVFRLSLAEWDSLVSDVEDPNDSLRWAFSTLGPVAVYYDSLLRQITLAAPEDYHGSDDLTAVVTDRGGLSDTMTVAVIVLPFNDPPQIDSSLFAITFDQKDTVEYQLDIYVSDRDHDARSMQWQFCAAGFVYCGYTDTSRRVRFWTDPDRFGFDSLLAIVTDPLGGADSQYLKITVTDTTEPTFELAIFQNQLASRFVEIDVFPSELMADRVQIITDGDTLPVLQDLDADSAIYYNATYQIEKTGIVQIRIAGSDLAGNRGDYTYQIGVSRISRETGGALTDPDSIMSFLFAANAVPMDLCALFIPYKAALRPDTALSKSLFGDDDFAVSDEFDFRIPIARLEDNARIMFNLDKMLFLQQYAAYLGIYRLENGEWQYLKTYTSLEKGSYWAYTVKPGIYQIRVNSANPAVILPEQFSVGQNYPNPFNSQTTIHYTIGAGGFVTFEEAFEELVAYNVSIKIYNLLGQEVATLINRPQLPGHYSVTWNGRNNYGKTVATGIYIYQVILGDKVFHKKMTVLK